MFRPEREEFLLLGQRHHVEVEIGGGNVARVATVEEDGPSRSIAWSGPSATVQPFACPAVQAFRNGSFLTKCGQRRVSLLGDTPHMMTLG